jgi:hypothetical protein
MRGRRTVPALVAWMLLVGAGFGAGWFARDGIAHGAPVFEGAGRAGADQATVFVGDDAYGFESSVSWTDAAGTFHGDGWPECVPHNQDVTHLRFAGMTVWAGDSGIGTDQIVWVDCRP